MRAGPTRFTGGCDLITRRHFCTAATAALALPAIHRANAQEFILPEEFLPREVKLKTELAPFELHVDPNIYALFWTQPKRKAMRYAVGIGRTGLYESGEFTVGAKKKWPSWTPTPEMIERDPRSYEKWADGMPGGPENPLGARAPYLFDANGRDTFLRIHGTNDPRTIGRNVSNGCARLTNEHISLLYEQVPVGTRVVLHMSRREERLRAQGQLPA
jgi:lipoprotein-anchoring transpeptidase ErfK/SrfK